MSYDENLNVKFYCGRCFRYSKDYNHWNCRIFSLPKRICGNKVRCPTCGTVIIVPIYTGKIEIAEPVYHSNNC